MRLTSKEETEMFDNLTKYYSTENYLDAIHKLGQLEDIEDELGIDLITFLKGIDPNTCFMEITKDKTFYLCGDAYYGDYSKEELLRFIQQLIFMYWALAKEELEKGE